MMEIIEANPASNFIIFTHVNAKAFWHPDLLIRKALALRYRQKGVTLDTAFSHCGTVWHDKFEEETYYWHQTFPFFAKDAFGFRAYNVIYRVDNPSVVLYARNRCEVLYDKKKPYGVGKLLAYIVTLWFTWFSNPIKAGKVCSEAVAHCYPHLITTKPVDTDPIRASFELDKAKLIKYVIDRT